MNEKELALMERLIDMLGGAGEGAFWLIVAWIGKGYFIPVVVASAIILFVFLLGRFILNAVTQANDWDTLRSVAECSSPWGTVYPREKEHVYLMIQKGVEAKKKGA